MKILKLNFYLFVQNLLINSMNPKSLSKCNTCGSIGTIIEDNASGFLTCTNCGSIQGLTLSNEPAFTELSNGNSSKNGQFVASHSQKSNNLTTTAVQLKENHEFAQFASHFRGLKTSQKSASKPNEYSKELYMNVLFEVEL